MAKEEKKAPEKKAKSGNKFIRWITSVPKRIWHAFQNMIAELKKVTWPTAKELRNYTTIVIIFMVLMAIIVGLLDLGASELISLIIRKQ